MCRAAPVLASDSPEPPEPPEPPELELGPGAGVGKQPPPSLVVAGQSASTECGAGVAEGPVGLIEQSSGGNTFASADHPSTTDHECADLGGSQYWHVEYIVYNERSVYEKNSSAVRHTPLT